MVAAVCEDMKECPLAAEVDAAKGAMLRELANEKAANQALRDQVHAEVANLVSRTVDFARESTAREQAIVALADREALNHERYRIEALDLVREVRGELAKVSGGSQETPQAGSEKTPSTMPPALAGLAAIVKGATWPSVALGGLWIVWKMLEFFMRAK